MTTAPVVHLRHGQPIGVDLTARCVCGVAAWHWTDDPQAVTCSRCIAHMELQPA